MILRGFAFFLAVFTVINLLRGWVDPVWHGNIWWIDLRILPRWLEDSLLLASAAAMGMLAFSDARWRWLKWPVALLTAACLWNAVQFHILLATGQIQSALPIPLSLVLGLLLLGLILTPRERPVSRAGTCLLAVVWACVFPLLLIASFGTTDYRRPADAIVVFGARAYADGSPSQALADRVRTGCDLYREGRAARLLFSGGPGDGEIHETQAMRRLALSLGVPDSAILLDTEGRNSLSTAQNVRKLFTPVNRLIAVSHFYHLPRVKLAFATQGLDVYTVPAIQTRRLARTPQFMLREIAGFWAYFFGLRD